jgi:WD40 repeat protein
VKLWNIQTGKCVKIFIGHLDTVFSVSYLNEDKFIISGSLDKNLKLWNVQTGECVKKFEGHSKSVSSVSFSND